MTEVAVVGLGGMGQGIATRLQERGHRLLVWNRTQGRARALLDRGAAWAESPADAARRAQVLITMVSDPAALVAVTEGPAGVAAGAVSGLTVIEMSTVGGEAVRRLRRALPEGVGLLDSPVLGSISEAASGTLQLFVGGNEELYQEHLPLLAELGRPLRTGELGSGASAKLVANLTLLTTMLSVGEAVALGDALGLARDVTYQVLSTTPLATQAERRRAVLDGQRPTRRFPLHLASKDARLISRAAAAVGIQLPLAEASTGWFQQADLAGLGDLDYSAVLERVLRATAPVAPSSDQAARASLSAAPGEPLFDGLLLDLDGAVWLGGRPIPGAIGAIRTLRQAGVRLAFVTNEAARSREAIAARLRELGAEVGAEQVVTSASALVHELRQLPAGERTALVVGPEALHEEIRGAGYREVDPDAHEVARVVAVAAHREFDFQELAAATRAVLAGARLIATGRDSTFPTERGPSPGTGSVLAAIEVAGGVRATIAGKPEAPIFEMARLALGDCRRVAMVGDHLQADVGGARRAGLKAILVLTGVTSREDLGHGGPEPDVVLESIADLPSLVLGRESVGTS